MVLLAMWLLTGKARPAQQAPATSVRFSVDGSATEVCLCLHQSSAVLFGMLQALQRFINACSLKQRVGVQNQRCRVRQLAVSTKAALCGAPAQQLSHLGHHHCKRRKPLVRLCTHL